MSSPQTFTFKTVGSLPIDLDLYLPSSAKNVPILLWFHGGGLLQGTRKALAPHHVRGVNKHNYALVSADYRLCPQVTVGEVVDDVKDCLHYIKYELPSKVGEGVLDTSRIAISGSSAGGYLALLAGLYATDPAPTITLPIYPITDPLGTFFVNPQPHPMGHIEHDFIKPYLDKNAPAVSYNEPDAPRQQFYNYMMQEAIEADLLGVKKGDDTYIVAPQIKKKGSFVPTYIVHGDADTRVGVEQADEVVEALKDIGATVEYERPKGIDHLFDKEENVELETMYAFMKKYLPA